MTESAKSTSFRKSVIGLLILLCGVVVLLLVVLRSGWISAKIEKEFQLATGYEMALQENASIRSIYPNLGISIPSIIIKSRDQSGLFRRLRLKDVEVTLPFDEIREQFHRNIVVEVESVAAIVDSGTDSSAPENGVAGEQIESQIIGILNKYPNAGISLRINKIDFIYRQEGVLASAYQFLSNKLSVTENEFSLSGEMVGKQSNLPFLVAANVTEDGKIVSGEISATIEELNNNSDSAYSLSGRYQIDQNKFSLLNTVIRGPGLRVNGQLEIKQAKKTGVFAVVDFQQVELAHYQKYLDSSQQSSPYPDRLFSDAALGLFEPFDLDLKVTLGAVRLNNQPIITGDVIIKGNEETSSLRTERLLVLGGSGHLDIDIVQIDEEQSFSVQSYLDDAQLSRMQITNDKKLLFTEGKADIKVSLKSTGNSTASLARSLKGYFMFASSGVVVSQRYAESLDRGIVSLVTNKIDNVRSKKKAKKVKKKEKGSLPLNCASVKLVINDGYLEVVNGLVIELSDNILVSSGYIDLHSEKMAFLFRTKKKKIIDWSALSLIKFIELSGTINRPKITLDNKALLKQGLLTTASVFVGSIPPLVYRLAESGIKPNTSMNCISSLTR